MIFGVTIFALGNTTPGIRHLFDRKLEAVPLYPGDGPLRAGQPPESGDHGPGSRPGGEGRLPDGDHPAHLGTKQ